MSAAYTHVRNKLESRTVRDAIRTILICVNLRRISIERVTVTGASVT